MTTRASAIAVVLLGLITLAPGTATAAMLLAVALGLAAWKRRVRA